MQEGSLVEGDEGLYRPNCQTNLVSVLHGLSLLFLHLTNTTAYHFGCKKPSPLSSKELSGWGGGSTSAPKCKNAWFKSSKRIVAIFGELLQLWQNPNFLNCKWPNIYQVNKREMA